MAKTDTSNLARLASNISGAYDKVIDTTREGEVATALGDAIVAGVKGYSLGVDIQNGIEQNKLLTQTNESNINATIAENQAREQAAIANQKAYETIANDPSLQKTKANAQALAKPNPMTRQ